MSARNTWPLALSLTLLTAFLMAGCGNQQADAGSESAEKTAAGEALKPAVKPAAPAGGASKELGPGRSYQNAPDFMLEKLGGGTIQLSSLRGKVVLVDFWATWCGPCRASIPHLNSLYAAHKGDGFELVGVSLDRGRGETTGLELVRTFAKTTPMNYPVAMGSQATAASFGGVRAIPTAFLIDKNGKIRNRFVGMQPAAVMEKAVLDLLAESADGDELI